MNCQLYIVIALVFELNTLFAQPNSSRPEVLDVPEPELKLIAPLPKILKEASGLEITESGLLWTHNDDRLSILYALDTLGNIVKTIHLNHPNNGWEDLARDNNGNIYVGCFGNNKNNRKNLAIYKVPYPENIEDKVFNAGVIEYVYADQTEFPPPDNGKNFDVDAFVSIGDSLYLFTKNRTHPFTGYAKVYRLPQEPGKYAAILYDSIYLGEGPMIDYWVTSADVSPDGKWLALLSHDCMWIISGFENKRFSSGKVFRIDLQNFSHKAGVCFASANEVYVVDELELGFLGGKIYSIDLEPVFRRIEAIAGAVRGNQQGKTGLRNR